MSKCYGCFGDFDNIGPAPHPYIGACAGCWDVQLRICAREYEDPEYFKVHRVTVDTYGAQHVGDQSDRRARQSANLHLIALYLVIDQGKSHAEAGMFLKEATKIKLDWPPVNQLDSPQWITVNDVIVAKSAQEHAKLVLDWGKSAWQAYESQHQSLLKTYGRFRHGELKALS